MFFYQKHCFAFDLNNRYNEKNDVDGDKFFNHLRGFIPACLKHKELVDLLVTVANLVAVLF